MLTQLLQLMMQALDHGPEESPHSMPSNEFQALAQELQRQKETLDRLMLMERPHHQGAGSKLATTPRKGKDRSRQSSKLGCKSLRRRDGEHGSPIGDLGQQTQRETVAECGGERRAIRRDLGSRQPSGDLSEKSPPPRSLERSPSLNDVQQENVQVRHQSLQVLHELNHAFEDLRQTHQTCLPLTEPGLAPPVSALAAASLLGAAVSKAAPDIAVEACDPCGSGNCEAPALANPPKSEFANFKKRLCKRFQRFQTKVSESARVLQEALADPCFSVMLDPKLQYSGRSQIDLLEVFAYPASRLTDEVNSLGGTARRFTLADGDLSTKEGQRQLCEVIYKYQPRHIFVAPEMVRLESAKSS